MRRALALCVAFAALMPAVSAEPPEAPLGRAGVLVLAHGGANRWNSAVRKAVKGAKLKVPVEVAFGMAMHAHEMGAFQDAVDRLERKGITRIIAIPLLVSSHSEVYRQYEYVLGLRPDAPWPDVHPLRLEVPVALGDGLDASPVVGEILLDCARTLSRQPSEETVILLAHGPNDEAENAVWLADMRQLEEGIKSGGGFRAVRSLTLRDDAPQPVQDAATEELRQAVQEASRDGRALVVPVLIAQGGIERKIPQRLAGLTYQFTGRALLPDPRLSVWIAEQVRQLIAGPAPVVLQ